MKIERDQVELSSLPPQMRRLIAVLGFDATIKLLRERGGRRIWVPKTAAGDRVLAQVVGHRALEALVEHYAGEMLELPSDEKLLIQMRNRMLVARRAEGASYAELAQEFGVSRRWAIELCNTAREDQRQGRLFDACANGDSGAH